VAAVTNWHRFLSPSIGFFDRCHITWRGHGFKRWYSQPVNYALLLFPDFLLILCGYLVCRFTALNRTVWEQVDALVYYFLFPVLLFQSVVKTKLDLQAASGLIAAGWSVGLIGIAWRTACPTYPGCAPTSTGVTMLPAHKWHFDLIRLLRWPLPNGWPARKANWRSLY